jgi:signal transduction histidine kinase
VRRILATEIDGVSAGVSKQSFDQVLLEYDSMIEELRTRLNVLSTSLFLLDESSKPTDPKLKRYLSNINREMEKIRQIISQYPKNPK